AFNLVLEDLTKFLQRLTNSQSLRISNTKSLLKFIAYIFILGFCNMMLQAYISFVYSNSNSFSLSFTEGIDECGVKF
ncbi:20997_t:CDS:1, partial [Gigaspora margarita]